MSKLATFMKNALDKYPIVSNCVIYGSLCVGAEFSQQTLTKKILPDKSEPYDWGSIARYSIYGTIIAGPMLATWYRFLDQQIVGTAIKTVAKKVTIDQFTFTPSLLVVFYVSMSAMEKKIDLLEECREKFIPTFKTSCLFWLPVQTINFLLIPPVFRVTYIGTCSFAWINILCWIKRGSSCQDEIKSIN
ncbi:mpv17-like protein [Aethina tumida]|uniref:mpv17-like protein n=1 Tax=Aethina tumida TaxID=116153 RepID=UPI00096B51B1|nr:mpv17-like protein [Aethina tumida]